MPKPTTVIRLLVSTALLYGVYTETGIWTTLAISLIIIAFEILESALNETL